MLTYNQNLVADHVQGHAIVRAVAGSGKTTTLIELVKRLISKGIRPQDITLVVFNKDARKDIQKKLLSLGMKRGELPKVYTFHSLALKLYTFLHKKGLTNLERLEPNEKFLNLFALNVLNTIKSGIEGKPIYATKEESEAFINFIDIVKSSLINVEDAFDKWIDDKKYKYFIEAFYLFEERRLASKMITFSDLIKDVVSICSSNPAASDLIKGHVKYLLLDEVQDINEISVELAKTISDKKTNWIMVGDIDQCIYSWRGSEPEFLAYKLKNELESDLPIKEYDLPETFRYGHLISLMSNHLISHNQNRTDGLCISSNVTPHTEMEIDFYKEKGRFGDVVVKRILEETSKGSELKNIAILIRLYSFSTEIELALLKNNIPYFIEGDNSVFKQREISAMIGILELSQGILFRLTKSDIVKKINNIFSLCYFGIKIEAKERDVDRFILNRGALADFILSFDSNQQTKFKRERLQVLASTFKVIDSEKPSKIKPHELLNTFIKQNDIEKLIDLFSTKQEESDNKNYILKSFVHFIKMLDTDTKEVLEKINDLKCPKNSTESRLTISSVHKAKGLEWETVIIPGLEDGVFPYTKKTNNIDIEAERRLFYVALTRCKSKVILVCPHDKALIQQIQGTSVSNNLEPLASRFIFESSPYISRMLSCHNIDEKNPEINASKIGKRYIKDYISLISNNAEDFVFKD